MTLAGSQVGQAPIRCPIWITPDAKRIWRQIVPDLQRRGVLLPIDRMMLSVLCELLSQHQAATEAIDRDGLIVGDQAHPLADFATKAAEQITAICHAFGMSPLGRRELERTR